MNIVWDRILSGYGNALKYNPCATLIFLQWVTDKAGPNSAHELQSMNIFWERILKDTGTQKIKSLFNVKFYSQNKKTEKTGYNSTHAV